MLPRLESSREGRRKLSRSRGKSRNEEEEKRWERKKGKGRTKVGRAVGPFSWAGATTPHYQGEKACTVEYGLEAALYDSVHSRLMRGPRPVSRP